MLYELETTLIWRCWVLHWQTSESSSSNHEDRRLLRACSTVFESTWFCCSRGYTDVRSCVVLQWVMQQKDAIRIKLEAPFICSTVSMIYGLRKHVFFHCTWNTSTKTEETHLDEMCETVQKLFFKAWTIMQRLQLTTSKCPRFLIHESSFHITCADPPLQHCPISLSVVSALGVKCENVL